MHGTTLARIQDRLATQRYETARRLCVAALDTATPPEQDPLRRLLHDVLCRLGDIPAAVRTLQETRPADTAARLTLALTLAEDYHRLSAYDFFRGSEHEKAGLTGDEYAARMQGEATRHFAEAAALLTTAADRARLADALRRCGRDQDAAALAVLAATPAEAGPPPPPAAIPTGSVSGRIRLPDGAPAAGVAVTLGLETPVEEEDATTYLKPEMHYLPRIGELRTLVTRTDTAGRFRFATVPAGRQEFLAVTLDAAAHAVPTRFLAHAIAVAPGQDTVLDLVAAEWQSAPALPPPPAAPAERLWQGTRCWRVLEQPLRNPFDYDFPHQALRLRFPPGTPVGTARLLLLSSHAPEEPQPCQVTRDGDLLCFAALPARSERVLTLYAAEKDLRTPQQPPLVPVPEPAGRSAVLDTGPAQFRLAWGTGAEAVAPLLAVRGPDGQWRGAGRFVLPPGVTVTARCTELLESGPLLARVAVTYTLAAAADDDAAREAARPPPTSGPDAALGHPGTGALQDHAAGAAGAAASSRPQSPATNGEYRLELTAYRGEPYLLVRESAPAGFGGAFEFSLREFSGGRGYLHWCPENGSRHWSTLAAEERLLARLQEQTPWWIPPQGFGYAMTTDGLAGQDYVGVFTVRRGEWVDHEFMRLAQGPGDDPPERRELDWPYPEMVGSTISMITAHTAPDGDAFFRFRFFAGQRRWGLLVSSFAANDGPFKELGVIQHKNSSPRLQEFKDWLLDEPDHGERPCVVARRADLIRLRRKKRSPVFAPVWQRLNMPGRLTGAVEGMRFAVDADPAVAWRKKRELVGVARIRARMTLLGRDFGDMYSPVGARPITPWAEDYDLIAASGVFTPAEERLVRQWLMLMGHLYVEPDFMNWQFNSRNANFEADRVDVVGAIGLVFHGSPDADGFVRHAAELMERALRVYCTPGSGKWYENPACYYLQAAKCRTNLAFHLASHGVCDPTAISRFKDFLQWGVLLLTPPCPSRYDTMRDGCADYAAEPKVRRIVPVGDHAHVGPWVPEFYALMSKLYRPRDPAFADLLLWAYQAGGADGGYFGNLPLFFAALEEADLRPAPPALLESRRLEGFGAIFRDRFGAPDEFCLLLKQGPGGYRYHRTEGSLLLFADGKPLVYDGGEAGETWRHTTLSFGATHMPLAPGHVERFHALPGLGFCQGVHPKALVPGDPVFLSDLCHHELEQVAYARYAEPHPADVRTVVWVKDEYVLLHDDLALPPELESFWHLQAVAGGETRMPDGGWRFHGRFGTDLQLLLPGQRFAAADVDTLPTLEYRVPPEQCFAMRHLRLSGGRGRTHYLALLRPLTGDRAPLAAELLTGAPRPPGVRVRAPGVDDTLFLARAEQEVAAANGVRFHGRYGAVLRRAGGRTTLALLAGRSLAADGLRIESDGPAALLERDPDGCTLTFEGTGRGRVCGLRNTPLEFTTSGERRQVRLP